MDDKTTLVVGASLKPDRYSNKAVMSLRNRSIKTFAFGPRTGAIGDVIVKASFPEQKNIHTVTMYVAAARQPQYYNEILGLNPSRVIFNPGAENSTFTEMLENRGIEAVEGCTLVMLSIGNY